MCFSVSPEYALISQFENLFKISNKKTFHCNLQSDRLQKNLERAIFFLTKFDPKIVSAEDFVAPLLKPALNLNTWTQVLFQLMNSFA